MVHVQQYREKALQFYGRQCEHCGDSASVEVHHIDENRSNDSIGNLMVLCEYCHAAIHTGEIDPFGPRSVQPSLELSHEQKQVVNAIFRTKAYGDGIEQIVQDALDQYIDGLTSTVELSELQWELIQERNGVHVQDSDGKDIIVKLED